MLILKSLRKEVTGTKMISAARMCIAGGVAAFFSLGTLTAQTANQSSAQSAYYGSGSTVAATGQVQHLSLDDAIHLGIEHNLALTEARAQLRGAHAHALQSLQPLLPDVTAQAERGAHQFNLAAEGFSPRVLQEIEPLFPGMDFSNVPLVVKVDSTAASLNYSESLFNLSLIDQYRAAKADEQSAYYTAQSSRGLVVLNVGFAYLDALAAESRLTNAQALLRTDQQVLNQAIAMHQAGTAAKLDELRARVQFQAQQQAVVAAENTFDKSKIALNREIGLAPEQEIQLTDASPYSEIAEMDIAEAKRQAYQNRQDYQEIQSEIKSAELKRRAAKWERFPSLDFNGNYGVTGVAHGLYHGTFIAEGTLNLPLFQEAKFRGDREVADARLGSLLNRLANLKQEIEQQLRDSMLDVSSTSQLVKVASSNVDLARQELDQSRQRFQAGVDDSLAVVEAQSTLASADSDLVSATVEFNKAKLGLARNLGIIDSQYKAYLRGN
jgi:outer membrane protein TolC